MKKAKRIVYWIIVNGLFAWAMWAAFIQDAEGARRVAAFYVWFCFLGSLAVFIPAVRADLIKRGPPTWPALDSLVDAAFTLFLVWNGCWLLAVLYAVHTIFLHGTYAAAAKQTASAAHA